jgi:hypothetical protein
MNFHLSRATRQGSWLAASAVEVPSSARRRGHWEPRSMSMQQAGCVVVGASVAAMEDASLATSRWCQSIDCRRRARPRRPYCCCHYWCRSHWSWCSCLSPSPYPYLCHRCWGWGQEGEGSPEDTMVPAVVDAEAATAVEGTFHLRAPSRTWRTVPRPPSGPTRSPRVRGNCGQCGSWGMAGTA